MIMRLFRRGTSFLRTEVLVLPSRIIVLAFVLGLLLLPLISSDPYILRVLIMCCLFATFAASWDFLAGYSGQVNFGHALFFGAAAYASAMLNTNFGISAWITIPIGAMVAGLSGVLIGLLCLRLRGSYLSLVTLSLPIILVSIFFAIPEITGGELGIRGVEQLTQSRVTYYYLAVALMLISCFVLWKIGQSKIGLLFHALREDQVALRAAGINTTKYKLLAFAISGTVAGLAGAFFGHFMRTVGPSVLATQLSFEAVIFAIVGGVVSIVGPIVAVFTLVPLVEYLSDVELLSEFRLLIFSLVVILVLLFMPRGFVPWIRDKIETVCPRCKNRNTASRTSCRVCSTELE